MSSLVEEKTFDTNLIREQAYNFYVSSYFPFFCNVVEFRIKSLDDQVFSLDYSEENDRKRLALIIQKHELERLLSYIRSLANEYVALQQKKKM